jgi:isoleucyl-tRNA synthetase
MLRNLKQFNLPEIEKKILEFWKKNDIFKKSVALRQAQGKKPFRFFEGPPTANGRPHIGHAETRIFKDIILRYKTMRGYYVPRRAGWDTHGLPVEIEVEKDLNLKNKQDIEKFGIAEFNTKAKTSVWKYKSDWEKFTERIGFWLDLNNPYITYENKYIETLWWIFSQIASTGLLKKLYKVVPWCPRCQTPLSSHELGQPGAYRLTKDPSVFVKLKIKNQKSKIKNKEYLLVWTTTPWTLPANVAAAVNPKLTYTKYKVGDEYFWSYNVPPKTEGKEIEVVEKIAGKRLLGWEYEPLYKLSSRQSPVTSYQIIAADFVSTEEGTGLVHIAPAFGEDDLNVFKATGDKEEDIPVTIDDQGRILKGFPGAGKFIKEADKDIIADLKKRNLLYHVSEIEHDYPFCWRCSNPLIYFARYSWFIEMSRLRDKLIAVNKKINWIPEHLKEGRFGEWLREIKDWAISRDRYWGTPLPIWEHEYRNGNENDKCDNILIAGSLDDLNKHAYSKNRFFIVRHGESDHNLNNVIASGSEKTKNPSRLTEKGAAQAEATGRALKKIKIDAIYSSPYCRTKQTAHIISKIAGVKVEFDPRLAELNTGIFNWRPVSEHKKFFSEPLEEFYKTPPGGENLTDAKKRMLAFLKDVNRRHQNKKIAIVSHGDPLWVMEGAAKGLTNEEILKISYPEPGAYKEIEFYNWPLTPDGFLDMHKPYADEIYLECPRCGERMKRVKAVADVWFDSGAMPFAQWHYPFEKYLEFPADYIVEAIDQTRGWFYTLLAVSVLLGRGAPYRNVISLGHVLDKNGQKMSKSKGNVVDPMAMMEKYGADVLRWHFYTVNPPGEPKKFDENDLRKTLNRLFILIYNSYVFCKTYGGENNKPNQVLDEWILARLRETKANSTKLLENYQIGEAAKRIESLVDDLSRWYIRRSRKNVSGKILKTVLDEIAKLIAPFTPFFAEALYQSLHPTPNTQHPTLSVHLEDWPEANEKRKMKNERPILEKMAEVRRLASLALAEREKAGIKVRQPLATLIVRGWKFGVRSKRTSRTVEELLELLKDEVNVKEIKFDPKIQSELKLDTKITPELRNEGIMRELVRLVQDLRKDARYQPEHVINLYIEAPKELLEALDVRSSEFKKSVNAKEIIFKKSKKFDAELNTKLEDWPVWVAVNRI